jgi:hypothetical protein
LLGYKVPTMALFAFGHSAADLLDMSRRIDSQTGAAKVSAISPQFTQMLCSVQRRSARARATRYQAERHDLDQAHDTGALGLAPERPRSVLVRSDDN